MSHRTIRTLKKALRLISIYSLLPEKAIFKVDPRNTKASWNRKCFILERQNETNWCLLGIDSYSFEIWFVKSCFIVSIREQYLCGWCIMHASHLRYCQSKLQARSISDTFNFVPTFWMVLSEMVMMCLCLY